MDIKKEVGASLSDEELMNMTGGSTYISSAEVNGPANNVTLYGIMPAYGIMPKYGVKPPINVKYGVRTWTPVGPYVKYGAMPLYGIEPE